VVRLPQGVFRYDRFVSLLSAASGIDIVADYYVRALFISDGEPKTIKELLQELRSWLKVQATWSPTALRLTCKDWFVIADCEPDAEVVDLVEAAAKEKSEPAFETLLQVVGRSNYHQLSTLERHSLADGQQLPAPYVRHIYGNASWLRLYAMLPASSRKEAESRSGLNLSRLPPATSNLWRQVAVSRGISVAEPTHPLILWRLAEPSTAFPEWRSLPQVRIGPNGDRSKSVELWQSMQY
jgi:hypothetical protein